MGSTPPDAGSESGRHDGSGSEPSRPRVKRAQVPRACPRCRKLQKACSDFRPCQRCVRAGLGKQCGPGLALDARLPHQVQAQAQARDSAASSHAQAGHTALSVMPMPGPATTTSSSSVSAPTSVPSPSGPLINSAGSPSAPLAYTSFARDTFLRQSGLLPPQVIQHCAERFHERLYPTIPIVTPEYVRHLESRLATDATEAGSEAYVVLLGMCAMVMLQVEDPSETGIAPIHITPLPKNNRAYGSMLLEEALAAHRHLARRPNPSFEHVLLTFFIYASHGTLLHHSQAFFFLREATTLHHLTRPETMDPSTRQLSERLFWVLLISERSHGIRYRRPVTLQVTSAGPILPPYIPPNSRPPPQPSHPSQTNAVQHQPLHAGFVCLAALFRPLDTSFIAILNQELTSIRPSIEALDEVEAGVSSALEERVMNAGVLEATQKANLHITQAWLLVTIWQLRLRLGQLIAPGAESLVGPTGSGAPTTTGGMMMGNGNAGGGVCPSRTYGYPLQIARRLTVAVQDLPVDSVRVHGVGVTEKVFDIACAVANVLARIPFFEEHDHHQLEADSTSAGIGGSAQRRGASKKAQAEHDFAYLRGLMQQLPSGATVYEDLLVKHISQDTDGVVAT